MITLQDLYNIARGKITNETGKAIIRSNFPPHIAERPSDAIVRKDGIDKFNHIMTEYNEWLTEQQRQLQNFQHFLMQHFK